MSGALTDARARNAARIAQLYAQEPQLNAAKPLPEISAAIREPGVSLARLVETVLEGYATRPALGQRVDGAFETIAYGELSRRVHANLAAWQADGLQPGDFVAILGFTSIDYTVIDLTCILAGAVSVPMQASAAPSQLAAILAETEPRIVATSVELLDDAVALVGGTTAQKLVVFDGPVDVDRLETARQKLAPISVETLDTAIERGGASPSPTTIDGNDDTLNLIIYTSGSTGTPKGAMYTEKLVKALWLSGPLVAVINLNYAPMSHILGRATLAAVLARGGTGYFTAKSDLSTLFDDLAAVRPTEMTLVPRVCDMVFQRYQSEVARGRDEAEVKAEMRQRFFGGRVMSTMVGSAPLAPEMRAFMESILDIVLHDGYGSTEAGNGVIIDNRVRRPPVIDYKLIDVPELGYFGTDHPHPRGELLVKTTSMIPGYYKRPDVTAAMFDEDGFYRTGDIVAELEPDRLVYVDRRNNVLKLSQGEFVTVAKLEAEFVASPLIRQIYVYGTSERAYLLAVVVPTGNHSKQDIAQSIQQIAKDTGLQSYEIPRDFIIESEPFTQDNGLLSGIGKLLRPKLKQRYGDELERLYMQLAEAQNSELLTLRTAAKGLPVFETVSRAACAVLGCSRDELRPDLHFTDLGGDSLSALSLSNLLFEILGVEVPVGVVNNPTNDLQQLAAYIEKQRVAGSSPGSFAAVHPDESTVRAAELTLDKFIDRATLDAAPTLPPPVDARTVLLTGANGYLGRFLCLEWLKRLKSVGGTLVCLVRGADAAAARNRLESVFSGDPELLADFRALEDSLEVIAGDVGEPDLGLDAETWQRLARDVDRIVHSAALVNHVLPYRQLFGPNVFGTAQLIRLALTDKLKPIDFLSTVAVAAQAAVDEFGDIREQSPVRTVDASYANGYGNSKWAAEVLLREAHDLCGLPIAVFRSDMILAHSRYRGQLNVPDVFTRLLLSLLLTGIAPASFYRGGGRAHYEGLPADFTAEAITILGTNDGFTTYNVLNPHDDGISLDRFVDWLIEAGHPIRRIDDYADWVTRFEGALRALPEAQRSHSVLPLMQAYARPAKPIPGSLLPTARFEADLREIPHLTPELIEKYVADLKYLELL